MSDHDAFASSLSPFSTLSGSKLGAQVKWKNAAVGKSSVEGSQPSDEIFRNGA